jgi:cytochrome c-type biogenesis protein CcmH/NrfF
MSPCQRRLGSLLTALVVMSAGPCFAQQGAGSEVIGSTIPVAGIRADTLEAADPAPLDSRGEARFKTLALELRCLVCQNQTLFDSTAPLAEDLRTQIKMQITQGRTDDQILAFMVERYGDFILYKPPVKPTTWLLWGLPFVLLLGGFWALIRIARRAERSNRSAEAAPSTERLTAARAWLESKSG